MKKTILFVSMLFLSFYAQALDYSKIFDGMSACFMLYDLNQDKIVESYNSSRCGVRISPCSTFKIPLSLIGFDVGILEDETHPEWKFRQEYSSPIESHNKDQIPKSWMANSVVWYSQILTEKLGMDKFKEYVMNFSYGNEDLSGNPVENDGLTNAWLNSSLKISAEEQVRFLKKFLTHQLPVSHDAVKYTKDMMFIEQLDGGFKLYGKTGSAIQKNEDGSYKKHMGFGWFIGFLEKDGQTYIFALNLYDQREFEGYAGSRAKAIAKEIFAIIDVLK